MTEKRLFIAGASGLIGGNCLKLFGADKNYSVKGTYFSYPARDTVYYDTLNPGNPDNFDLQGFKPTYILHAGALTHVDYCEAHPEESYEKTVTSTRNLLAEAKKCGAFFIYISTDYVFDGQHGPYMEEDTLNPLSVYGRHKLEAEEMVRHTLPGAHLILRVTNVYGDEERNKNFIARLVQAAANGEKMHLKLPYDQYATPVNAWDVASALHTLLDGGCTGTYHIASTDYLNRVQLAQKVLGYFNTHEVTIEAISTASLGQAAARPLQGGLKAAKFLEQFPMFRFSSVDMYLQAKLSEAQHQI